MLISTDTLWFHPVNVLYHFARLDSLARPEYKRTKEFRKAYEANLTAIMLMGIVKLQKQNYWMQLVEDKEGTPDIRTFRYAERNGILNWQEIQEVEVVQYEYHSNELLTDFLKNKKLPPKKSYPETTTILCLADKITLLPPWQKQFEALQDVQAQNPVIILGKTHPDKNIYTICQIHPEIDLLCEFNLEAEAVGKKSVGVLKVHFDPKGKPERIIHLPDEKHYPFETLGIKKP